MNLYECLVAACMLAAIAVRTTGAEPLSDPVAVGSRFSHSLCEKFINGPYAGKSRSLICDLAGRPAVLVYTREVDPTLVTLLVKLDAVAQGGKGQKMKSSCVLLATKDEDLEIFQTLAKHGKLENTFLAVAPLQWERPYFGNNPGRRNLQKEAAVTVILLQRLTVQSFFSFREGELKDRHIDEIVKATSALLPPLKQ